MAEKNKNKEASQAFEHLLGSDQSAQGYEQLTADVMAFPFIKILQDLSPQCKRSKPEYIEGAEAGVFCNSVNDHLYHGPLKVVVGKFERYFIEWKPNRGGFNGSHDPIAIQRSVDRGELYYNERNALVNEEGHEFMDTYVYYVILPDQIEEGVCLLSLSKTQLKEAKKLNRNLLSTVIPGTAVKAMPHHMVWSVTSPVMSNDQGEWQGIKFEFSGFVDAPTLQLAESAREEMPSERVDLAQLDEGPASNAPALDVGDEQF